MLPGECFLTHFHRFHRFLIHDKTCKNAWPLFREIRSVAVCQLGCFLLFTHRFRNICQEHFFFLLNLSTYQEQFINMRIYDVNVPNLAKCLHCKKCIIDFRVM